MKSFEKLLNKLRKDNPSLITEEEAQAFADEYNAYEKELQTSSFDQGKAAGFEEGYKEGVENTKAQCKIEFDELLEKTDEDAANKLESIIKMLNDAHAEKLQEVYDTIVEKMVPKADFEKAEAEAAAKLTEACESVKKSCEKKLELALEEQDADYAAKFQEAIDAIDASHAKKLQKACDTVKATVTEAVEKKYKKALENAVNKEKANKMSIMAESVEKYLKYALQDAIPAKSLISEAKYNASQKAIEKISSILKINNILQESKDGIFADYENKLAGCKKEQDKLIAENVELKAKLEKEEAKVLLESKIAKCTPDEALFLRSYFESAKNPQVIEEQIEEARTSFRRIHAEKRNAMVENAKNNIAAKPSAVVNESRNANVKEPAKKVVAEQKNTQKQDVEVNPFIAAYSEMLKNR